MLASEAANREAGDDRGDHRVQCSSRVYLGARFDPEEFRRDLLSLMDKE